MPASRSNLGRPLRVGTRGSPLALAQARSVKAALLDAHRWGDDAVEIRTIATEGDRVQDRPLAEIGGKALWTKSLDRALIEARTDISVHSMKDVETERTDQLLIGAYLPRADIRDRLIGAASLAALARGAIVGTSSPRRAAQLLRLRPDVKIVSFRGNVATRLARLERGEAAATFLAAAGLDRLGWGEVGVAIPVDTMLPAVGQGAIGVECRADDRATQAILAAIDNRATRVCVEAERGLLGGLGGSCHSPVGVLARLMGEGGGDTVHLRAEILSEDGELYRAGETRCAPGDADAPRSLARALLASAPPELAALFACAS